MRLSKNWKKRLTFFLPLILSILSGGDEVIAQVTAGQPLSGSENTQVNFVAEDSTYQITGGAVRGNDGNFLFHSFENFSLENGQSAFFDPSDINTNIETIFTRVTGSPSRIDGVIRADNADVFFINPKGIWFGPNASLEVGGSFIASTAGHITFSNGAEFSASNPQSVPLLNVSQPIGLSLAGESSNIVNESVAVSNTLGVPGGLEVPSGQSIMLIGNGVSLPGGRITVPSGQIELASIAPGGSVSLVPLSKDDGMGWVLNHDDESQEFSEFLLSEGAFIFGTDFGLNSNESNSSIRLSGRQIFIEGSGIFADNYGPVRGEDLVISASEQLTLSGGSTLSASTSGSAESGAIIIHIPSGLVELLEGSQVLVQAGPDFGTLSTGNSSGVAINAASLILQDKSDIDTSAFSEGNSGNIDIDILGGTVELLSGSRLFAQSSGDATGNAGNITINTENISIRDGAGISTTAEIAGTSGDITVNAHNGRVEIVGISLENNRGSFLQATTQISEDVEDEDSGNIYINARNFLVKDGAQVLSGTFLSGDGGDIVITANESVTVTGEAGNLASQIASFTAPIENGISSLVTGNAGDLEISTGRLEVSDGASIFTSTSSSGEGGDLTVQANEVLLLGQGEEGKSGLFARARSVGDSGILNLTTDTLRIENGARFTVSTRDVGESIGELSTEADSLGTVRNAEITARAITLNNGSITAESLSGNGGNIILNVEDFLLLRNNSLVSATAGTAALGGRGGNVTINSPDGILLAVPEENSDIIANAFEGAGGNVGITALSILGVEERPSLNDNFTNDISASSEFGPSGTVSVNNLDPDPAQGTIELPTNTAEPYPVAQRCLADSQGQNAFVMTGQGGAPPNPRDIIRNESIDLAALDSASPAVSTPSVSPPLVEAGGWRRDVSGTVVLLAQTAGLQAGSGAHYHSCVQQSRG